MAKELECFLCSTETKSRNHYYSDGEEHSMTLCQILDLSPSLFYDADKYGKIIYCPKCRNKIWKIKEMLEELERLKRLEIEVSVTKDNIRHQLRERCKLYSKNPNWTNTQNQRFRVEIVNHLKCVQVQENGAAKTTKPMPALVPTKRRRYAAESAIMAKKNDHVPIGITPPNVHIISDTNQTFFDEQTTPNIYDGRACIKREPEDIITSEIENQMSLDGIEPGSESNESVDDDDDMSIAPNTNFCEVQLHVPEPDDGDSSEIDNLIAQEKNYICGTCGVMFDFYKELEEHGKFHEFNVEANNDSGACVRKKRSSKLPKKCEECGKVLSTATTWRNHVMTVHRRECKFKCPHCDFGCQQPANLKDHIQTAHTDENRFSCRVCSSGFKLKRYLVTHLQKKHGCMEADEVERNIVELLSGEGEEESS